MKFRVYGFLLLCLGAGQWLAAQQVDYSKLKKELNILTKILKTSWNDFDDDRRHGDSEGLQPRLVHTTYLKNQGAVLKISFGMGHFDDFHFDFGEFNLDFNMPELDFSPFAPMAPDAPDAPEWNEDQIESLVEAQEMTDEMAEQVAQAIEAATAALSESPFQSREMSRQIRDLRREQRDMAKSLRHKGREARHKLSRGGNLSETEKKQLLANIETYQQEVQKKSAHYMEKIKKLKQQQMDAWNKNVSAMEKEILAIICEYGGSLRSLPNDEYLTLILGNVDRQERSSSKDRIYVFKKGDLLACRNGEITLDTLKAKAGAYSF